jgi:hypothetical protein
MKRVHRYASLLMAYRYAVREVSVNDHINLIRNRCESQLPYNKPALVCIFYPLTGLTD